MKILQITPYYPPSKSFGGPPEVAHQLSLNLRKLTHEVTVLTSTIGTDLNNTSQNVFENISVKYHRVTFPKYWKKCKGFSSSLDHHIQNSDIILIHTIFAYTTYKAIIKCKKHNKKYYLFAHGMLDAYALNKNAWFKKLYINTFMKPYFNNGIIVFNAKEEQDNSVYKHFFSDSIVIPNGINPENFELTSDNFFEKNLSHLKSKKIFLFLGRLDPKKGLDILVHSFSTFSEKYPDAHLVIAGPDYINYQKSLEQEINKHDSNRNITFLGPIYGKEKFDLLKSVYAFVQPSYYEGLSISLLEAMASGLPIITSNQVGLHSILHLKDAAIIIKPNNNELLSALERLYLDEDTRKNISSNAEKIAFEEHSWNNIALMIQKLVP